MVDTKCTSKSKYRKQEKIYPSEAQDEDESLLRKPFGSFCAGFREAKRSYENGTEEVRRLLMQECSLIYECNVCRNMFRSLANFFCHKRNYCKNSTSNDFYSFPDRSSGMVIQTVERSAPFPVKCRSMDSSPTPHAKSSNRDLCKVIERLKRVGFSMDSNCNKTLAVDNQAKFSPSDRKLLSPVLELERVATTTQAVYKTLRAENEVGSIKTELNEAYNLLENQNVLLTPEGRGIYPMNMSLTSSNNTSQKSQENNFDTSRLSEISCEICKMQFQREKSLKIHMEKKHKATTYVFKCPTCSMTFLQPAAVIRHLANEHRKPLRRIRKLRDTILKKRVQIGDVQVKGIDREVKRHQIGSTKEKDTSNRIDQQNVILTVSCPYCSKNFERRAALATHLTNCSVRMMPPNKAELSMKTAVPNQHNETKTENQISNILLEHPNQNSSLVNEDIKVSIKKEPQSDLHLTTNKSSNTINKMFQNLENQTFGNGLHTVCLENIEMTVECNEKSVDVYKGSKAAGNNDKDVCSNQCDEKKRNGNEMIIRDKLNKKGKPKRFRVVSASKQLTCRCKICNKQFNALSNLRRHISMFHYRSKRFGCNLCDYRAFRRYDIVNHLTFVHKITGERETMAVEYVTVHEVKYSKSDVDGDIVLISEEALITEHSKRKEQHRAAEEPKTFVKDLKTYEERDKIKKEILKQQEFAHSHKKESVDFKSKSQVKVMRKKFKKSLEAQVENKKRPIRNRIKTVNSDFVYDLLTIKEEPKQSTRLTFKRSKTLFADQNNILNAELTPPPVKIIPYRLRTEPLVPTDKSSVKGVANNVFRNVINEGLAASSTLPQLPSERPQMRSRLISSSRSDLNSIPIIETSELEAAGLKSTLFDDSFLEKFARKSNPSFKMKPLLAMQHSPLNSILQKFDASQQNTKNIHNIIHNPPENDDCSSPNYSSCLLKELTLSSFKETDLTPNGKQIFESSSPPASPKKRITLMERLAENRAKIRDNFIRTALEN